MAQRKKLIEILSQYFTIGDSDEYSLLRDKSAFAIGTMSLEDFVEFDDEKVADIADYLLANGVVVPLCRAGDWIYVLPSDPAKTHPVRMQVQCVSISTDSRRAILRLGGDTVDALWNDDCGKTWFLSEDEAEAAIKKRRIQNE